MQSHSAIYDSFVGFGSNRYAYCMYNPLKYVDPTGERYFGWSGGSAYYFEQQARLVVLKEQYRVYEVAMESHWDNVNNMINSIYSQGQDVMGNGGSGNHGSCGGGNGDGRYSEEYLRKCEKLGITPGKPIPKEKQTNDFLKKFQEAFYSSAPMEHVKKFVVEFDNSLFYSINSEGKTVLNQGKTSNLFKNGFSTGDSYVYLNGNIVFNSPESLFYAMGHELIHVSQNIVLAGYPKEFLTNSEFVDVKEHWAYTWQTGAGCIVPYSLDYASLKTYKNYANPLNPSIMVDYTELLNYIYFEWLKTVRYPY